MSLENEVPTLELCKKWKEIGGRQDTEFCWCPNVGRTEHGLQRHDEICGKCDIGIAAPLEGEILIFCNSNTERWIEIDDFNKKVILITRCGYLQNKVFSYKNQSFANALLSMAIELKKGEGDG